MVPKRARDLYKIVAERLGISEDLAKDAVEFYWSEVRKALTEMRYHAIYIDNLGTFKAKEARLQEAVEKYQRMHSHNDGSTFRKMSMKKDHELRITKITNLLALIDADRIKKQSVKNKRNEALNCTNLEEQVVDTRGSIELDIQDEAGREDSTEEEDDM